VLFRAHRHAGSTEVEPEQKGRELGVEAVALHWAYNPVQTVWF